MHLEKPTELPETASSVTNSSPKKKSMELICRDGMHFTSGIASPATEVLKTYSLMKGVNAFAGVLFIADIALVMEARLFLLNYSFPGMQERLPRIL